MASAVDDVQSHLASQGLVDGGTWPSVRRRMYETDDGRLVVVGEDGGPRPEIPETDGIGDASMEDAGVIVTVRGPEWDGDASFDQAEAIRAELHGTLATTIGSTFYYRITALTPEPIFAGFDDKGRPLHTIAFRMMRDA